MDSALNFVNQQHTQELAHESLRIHFGDLKLPTCWLHCYAATSDVTLHFYPATHFAQTRQPAAGGRSNLPEKLWGSSEIASDFPRLNRDCRGDCQSKFSMLQEFPRAVDNGGGEGEVQRDAENRGLEVEAITFLRHEENSGTEGC